MTTTYLTSESVTEGHPDKLCDQVADAILDDILSKDPDARVACEVATTTGLVMVLGEITTDCWCNISGVVRNVVRDVGYTKPEYGFDHQSVGVVVSVKEQSPDIDMGVSRREEKDPLDAIGAGDQGTMVGFACGETPELMPLPIVLAHRLCRMLTEVRKLGILPYLRPDGKAQVTVEYENGRPKRVDSVVIAAQHDPDIPQEKIVDDMSRRVISTAIPAEFFTGETQIFVNATGQFVVGGPVSDTGCTGRKLLVDTYGSAARHGGGSFSGKDPTKVDRSAAYMARYAAKNLVAAGLAKRVEIQVSYAIGVPKPLAVAVDDFGTGVGGDRLAKLVAEHFDFRPAAIIERFGLRRPIYRPLAAYGHFGRTDIELPWEKVDRVEVLG
jgi:S-adenosylmethionine synthetase